MNKAIKVLAVIVSWFIRDYDKFIELAQELADELFVVLDGEDEVYEDNFETNALSGDELFSTKDFEFIPPHIQEALKDKVDDEENS